MEVKASGREKRTTFLPLKRSSVVSTRDSPHAQNALRHAVALVNLYLAHLVVRHLDC